VYNTQDNIVALATTPGKSALNVVRCSGTQVLQLYKSLTQNIKKPRPNVSHLKTVYQEKDIVDQLMLTYFKGPKSFTGQDMLELSVHGGIVIVTKIIKIIEEHNFRQAMPGEFSYRAFINGKIDLAQAEAISTIVDSGNNIDVLYSLGNLKGQLSKHIYKILNQTENIIIHIEHELDFDENEIDFVSIKKYSQKISSVIKKAKKTINQSYLASDNKSSLNICFVGKTNAGKSSLFNKMLGFNRSIVTKESGTTRDTVEANITIGKINATIVDTAGIRNTKSVVEKEGIARTLDAIKIADVVLFVDEKDPIKESKKYKSLLIKKHVLFIHSKADLFTGQTQKKTILTSIIKTGGLQKIFTELSTFSEKYLSSFRANNGFLINLRQKAALEGFLQTSQEALSILKKREDLVLAASSLRAAHRSLSFIVYNKNKDEIINKIFKGFCVGK